MKPLEHIQNILARLPNKPGIYKHFDAEGTIIYVGKAKDLKKRVSSYFNRKNYENGKTRLLVRKIADIQWIVTPTEQDALLLENNLIKEHWPVYNILLKDDKTFPYIVIKKERFPRVFSTRRVMNDGGEYFGPFTSIRSMRTVLDLCQKLYPIRSCSLSLTEKNIAGDKFRVCLEYHVGNCLGPCVGHQSVDDYELSIQSIRHVLKGNLNVVRKVLNNQMNLAVKDLAFEKAEGLKSKLNSLDKYQAKSTVVHPKIDGVDIFTIVGDDSFAYVNCLLIVSGAIIRGSSFEVKRKLAQTDAELLEASIPLIREKFNSSSREIFTSILVNVALDNVTFSIPLKGDKKRLVEMSEQNARLYMKDRQRHQEQIDPEAALERLMATMKSDLRLKSQPRHIECFDNSNLQGTNPTSACVVFRNGKPSKRDYRNFNIKTVEGPDDFASMKEAVYRRYDRLYKESGEEGLPQLIIIDGGKGQVSHAMEAVEELNLRGKVAVVGIAKRLEELFFPGDSLPIYLDKRSPTLKVIQNMRNEAHRFSLTHHRKKRSQSSTASILDNIPGVGEATKKKLLIEFGSVSKIKNASLEDLNNVCSDRVSQQIISFFKENKS
ncbi:MAG: excinuclease ABC subunit UvrC [Flavobacteriales bacterium]|nr:excinuclease ABC subunit UvrC [Flavobacteriales bacterium]